MTASIDNHELCAPAHLHQDTASVSKWFVADGERVHRFDVVAEMSDALGTETDVVATTDGYLTQAPPESTYARPGLAGWITSRHVSDFHQSVNDEQADATVIDGEIGYLVTRAVLGPESEWASREHTRVGALVAAAAEAAGGMSVLGCSDRVDVVVNGTSPGRPGVVIADARRLSASGIARVLDGATDQPNCPEIAAYPLRLEVHLSATRAMLYTPPHPDAVACLTVGPPTDEVIAERDCFGNPTVAVRACATLVVAYRPSSTTAEKVTTFGAEVAAYLSGRSH
ncbi:hypothetical protein QWI29_10240 [Mycolicibacterium neoaurum]|uniref:hypothetical protein n=1 Tax=Mycolicibacterium neoaurum TaxID=1795 RepID=UPI002670E39D|nr:hypothetical protein [Mycolicibacterium neoaurum]MDO3400408.1 hypothetical protein [Mycolicibacterium neoaurum]